MSAASKDPYRPLNVRDALSYLDQVKVQFMRQPEVYNRFLDVMKEFKSQTIDTPGVIDRVSTLFQGHPKLIQGFNTFLPPGYRIECQNSGSESVITVTTPTGTVSHQPGGFAAAYQGGKFKKTTSPPVAAAPATGTAAVPGLAAAASQLGLGSAAGSHPYRASTTATSGTAAADTKPTATPAPATAGAPATTAPSAVSLPANPPQPPKIASGPSTPSAANTLASVFGSTQIQPGPIPMATSATAGGRTGHALVEFNHAITFVNKIKNRFNNDAETYKQFLEILQTYQRDGKGINEVYAQVSKLFNDAPDLIKEFKQFLPEASGGPPHAGDSFGQVLSAANEPSAAIGQKRPSKEVAPPPAGKKRRVPEPKNAPAKKGVKADSPSADDADAPLLVPGTAAPQTLASPEEIAFFDKVKKYIDDKVTYHEFLKLINLFTQDMIDTHVLVDRAEKFLGGAGEIWLTFKKMVLLDNAGYPPANPYSSQEGYGFGGMVAMDGKTVELTPMLERVKPDLSGPRVKTYGPSYRKLPKTEVNLTCTGRDAMCWEVLNDEWVSHPTWAAEDAAPFLAHKKNAYEEALHKSEEERHEYDYHIEANLRTIAVLEPLNNKLQTMDADERARFNLKSGLGSQSRSIYQRIMKKVYGKELGHDITRAIQDNPAVALPIVLDRLKAKDEEWKKAQREWNRVWREQDAKNFYKALDHQGVVFKQNDKKAIATRNLVTELDLRRQENLSLRQALLDRAAWRSRPEFELEFKDLEVLKDVVKLVISYLDRVNNQLSTSDKEKIERQLRDFVPLVWVLDKEEFDAEFGAAEHADEESEDSEEEGDGDVSTADDDEASSALGGASGSKRKKGGAGDLRKKLLKQVGGKDRERGGTQTPAPEDDARRSVEGTPATENGERAETPVPVPDDPEAVAQAVEADKAVAEASEQTWVDIQMKGDVEGDISEEGVNGPNGFGLPPGSSRKTVKRANFYANTHFYVLVRLIQLLYTRLLTCKTIAADLARSHKTPINPIAIRLGLAEPETSNLGVEAGDNPAQHYYGHLLNLAEKLFENEVDIPTYEETLRVMFGTKAYVMFTLDRVVAAIVKQVQSIVGDMKSQEVWALLVRDRQSLVQTNRRQLAYRHAAENVIPGDEDFYRIQTFPSRDVITIKMMTKHDPTNEDEDTEALQWRNYVDSYVLTHSTEGLSQRVDEPLLKRNLSSLSGDPSAFERKDGLSCRIAIGTYRMFAVENTEDYFHHRRPADSPAGSNSEVDRAKHNAEAKARLEAFVDRRIKENGGLPAAAPTAAPPPAAATPAV